MPLVQDTTGRKSSVRSESEVAAGTGKAPECPVMGAP
eukprot:CAMPEP_0172791474 /NCGR_PEP_ID=MMETSP1074-20121228/208487_1 /TAXON_ID=2916 /ORGANISM="Ceratium fusus, Strain PA161109" /LENGTH=36 /DNA_ID= /DNA_START= /DNA_END= /DNA_ORIENTATION=